MKIQPYVEKLNSSSEYKEFQKKYRDAFMVAGFFVLDMESGKNLHQLDFYVPSKKKIAAFTVDEKVTVQLLDMLNKKAPEKLDIKTKVDLDQIYGILEDEMKNRNITDEIKKIIAILQNIDGKKIWNLNCVLSGMGILTAHVEDESKTVLKMEKKSLIDYMQKVSPQQLMQKQKPSTKKEVDAQIKKLDELESAIEKEKEELMKSTGKEKNSDEV